MRNLSVLFGLLAAAAALGHEDPFLPGIPLGAGPDAVRGAMGGLGWEIDSDGVDTGGWTSICAGKATGWRLCYVYSPDGAPFSITLAERWPEENRLAGSYTSWNERLSARFGDPVSVRGTYGDLLRWSGDAFTVELDLNDPEFYTEGCHTLVVQVLFTEAGGGD